MRIKRRTLLAAMVAGVLASTAPALAADWPNKPVRIIVPFGPGAGTDIIMRYFGQQLSEALGQSFVIENRPGANGIIGTASGVKAPADGYNFFVISNSTVSAAPRVYKDVPYDVDKDILPVAPFILAPSLLLAHPDFPANDFTGFIEQVKNSKEPYAYGHANTVGLVAGSALRRNLGLDLTEIPYKTSPQAISDVMGGQVSFAIVDSIAANAAIKGDRVKVLAITTKERSPMFPDTQTMDEHVEGVDVYAWVGLGAPAGTPEHIVERLNKEIVRISGEQKTIDYFAEMGSPVHAMSAAEYRDFVSEQNKHWAKQLEDAGVKPQ